MIVIVQWIFALRQKKTFDVKKHLNEKVSIVVPFRNEEKNIKNLILSLTSQSFPKELFEIILIDDHSGDQSVALIQSLLEKESNLRLLKLEEQTGKKAAIRLGIEKSQSDLIITTDADCVHDPNWLNLMVNSFLNEKPMLLCAAVKFSTLDKDWKKVFNLEQAALMAATAGSIKSGNAFMCNGANLMFPKALYLELKDEELKTNLASGDDVFLLHALKQKFGKESNISFLTAKEAIVSTPFPSSWKEFLNQKIRWAQKGKYYKDKSARLYGLSILLANLSLFISFFAVFFNQMSFGQFAFIFGLKCLLDFLLLRQIQSWYPIKNAIVNVTLLSFLYPFYTVGIALLSLLYRPVWKGRKI